MIVLKDMLMEEKMSMVKNTHSQTFIPYHNMDLFILIGLVPLIFKFNLNFLKVKTPRAGHEKVRQNLGKTGGEGKSWVEGLTPLRDDLGFIRGSRG